MLDTGAGPNLLKIGTISPSVPIDTSSIIILKGITPHSIRTLGKIIINLFSYQLEIHLVDENFPINEDGILGSDLLESRML